MKPALVMPTEEAPKTVEVNYCDSEEAESNNEEETIAVELITFHMLCTFVDSVALSLNYDPDQMDELRDFAKELAEIVRDENGADPGCLH